MSLPPGSPSPLKSPLTRLGAFGEIGLTLPCFRSAKVKTWPLLPKYWPVLTLRPAVPAQLEDVKDTGVPPPELMAPPGVRLERISPPLNSQKLVWLAKLKRSARNSTTIPSRTGTR